MFLLIGKSPMWTAVRMCGPEPEGFTPKRGHAGMSDEVGRLHSGCKARAAAPLRCRQMILAAA